MTKTKRILTVFGTRPEAIKMAPLVLQLQNNTQVESAVCVTAQHREMLDQVLCLFDISPDYDLDIMKQSQDLFDITSRVLMGMRSVLHDFRPDIVLVHGDTSTSFAVALAAFYEHIKIAHVEAGLRTWNLQSPWPEEANRQLTDVLADYYFAPTKESADNLRHEGRDNSKIFVTGNTGIDALQIILHKIHTSESYKKNIETTLEAIPLVRDKTRKMILITGHRRENFGEGFRNICAAIRTLAHTFPNVDFVYPVHLNPHIQAPVKEILSDIRNIFLVPTLDYAPFVYLMSQSYFILTDSGGIQEEAPALGKPVLVMRDTTERPEVIKAGTVKLVGSNPERIIEEATRLLTDSAVYEAMSKAHSPYGNGTASEQIIAKLIR